MEKVRNRYGQEHRWWLVGDNESMMLLIINKTVPKTKKVHIQSHRSQYSILSELNSLNRMVNSVLTYANSDLASLFRTNLVHHRLLRYWSKRKSSIPKNVRRLIMRMLNAIHFHRCALLRRIVFSSLKCLGVWVFVGVCMFF